jgi:hypothetical protein
MLPDLSDAAPYPLESSYSGVSYTFTTDREIKYLVIFDDRTEEYSTDIIGDSTVYEYQFYPTSNVHDETHDARIMATVMHSISLTLAKTQNVLLYICENTDERGAIRARMFDSLFRKYNGNGFLKIDGVLPESKYNDQTSYVSVIVSENNPYKDKINETFHRVLFGIDISKLPDF